MGQVDAALVRGGTSRGVVLAAGDVSPTGPERDRQVCSLIGTSRVDGLGGGSPVTEKVVLVAPGTGGNVDLDYIVGNVSNDGRSVDWSGTCGNMTSAVVPYAAGSGLVSRPPAEGSYRLRNLATGGEVEVSVHGHLAWPEDGTEIDMTTAYLDPGGAVTGTTLPTGQPRDVVEVDGEAFDVSVVDVTHPYLFVDFDTVVGGRDLETAETQARIERIRGSVCVALGLCATSAEAASLVPAVPRVVLIHSDPPADADLGVRAISMGRAIDSVPVTSALAIASAVGIRGTVLERRGSGQLTAVRVGAPRGAVDVEVSVDAASGRVRRASVRRTARVLMRGRVSV